MVGGSLGAKGLAEGLDEPLVPGGANDHLGREGDALEAARQAVETSGAIDLGRGGLADALNLGRGPAAVGDERHHVVNAQLLDELVPLGIVVGDARHVLEGDAVIGDHDGLGVRVVLVGGGTGDGVDHLVRGLLSVNALGGQRALPVGARDIGGDLAVGHVVKVVRRRGAVGGTRVALTKDLALGHGVGALVDDVVSIAHELDRVVARVEHVAALARVVVGGHVGHGKAHGHVLLGTRLEHLRLAKPGENHVALLDAPLGVGCGVVDLDDVLAGNVAGVLDGDRHGDGLVIGLEVLDALLKGGVGEAVAKRVLDHLVVGRLVDLAGGVVHPAGLVEAIADVDALPVLNIVVVVHVGVREVARVPVGRGRAVVVGVGVRKAAGGVDLAAEGIAHGREARGAGAADPHDGVDAAVLDKAELHGVGGVDEKNHALKARILDEGKEVLLVLGELEVAARVIAKASSLHVLRQVATLAADAGEHDHGHVGEVARGAHELVAVLGGGNLGGRKVSALKAALVTTAHAGVVVEVNELLVDLKAGIGEALDQVNVVGGVARAGAGAAVDGRDRGVAKEVDLGPLLKGQHIILVLEKHQALGLELTRDLTARLGGLLGREAQRLDPAAALPHDDGVQVCRHE